MQRRKDAKKKDPRPLPGNPRESDPGVHCFWALLSLREILSRNGLLYTYIRLHCYVLAIRLDPEIEERLARLAAKTGRTKTFYAREAILEYLEDMEDYFLAVETLQNPGRVYTREEVKRERGL